MAYNLVDYIGESRYTLTIDFNPLNTYEIRVSLESILNVWE